MKEQSKQVHRIRIQRVEVEFENPGDVFKTRDELSEVCRLRLIPAMEKLLDRKYADDSLISIPRLLIDAGTLDPENWEETLVKAVVERLEGFLDEKSEGKGHSAGSIAGSEVVLSSGGSGRAADFLLCYLEKGVLPWNSPYENTEQLKKELQKLLKQMFMASGTRIRKQDPAAALSGKLNVRPRQNAPDDFAKSLRELVSFNANALKRFLYLMPEKHLLPVLVRKDWSRREIGKIRKNWRAIFYLTGLPETDYDAVFLQALGILHDKVRGKAPGPLSETLSAEIVRVLEQQHQQVFRKLPDVLEKYFHLLPHRIITSGRKGKLNIPAAEKPFDQIPEEPVYIKNAGLVLLHPFLGSLFENTGYTMKNKWDSPELRQRSLILTEYLVRGIDEYAEQDIFLNKLLTGFHPDDPLPLDMRLSEFEKQEANDLLESVILHWSALKNTSAGALRETFLQRTGKLEKKDRGWLLQVDQKAPDVLLGKIPWGFSTIKTPWMNQILTVEWT